MAAPAYAMPLKLPSFWTAFGSIITDTIHDTFGAVTTVHTPYLVSQLVDTICELRTIQQPTLFVALEGDSVIRFGCISMLQIFVAPHSTTYLVDVQTLGQTAFTTCGRNGCTLADILSSPSITKVLFDALPTADALRLCYGIMLSGVQDIQLMELGAKDCSRRLPSSLAKCIDRDGPLTTRERIQYKENKENGLAFLASEHWGGYAVLLQRPLPREIMLYCAQEVSILPRLWWYYNANLVPDWRMEVLGESDRRITPADSGFHPPGHQRIVTSFGWYYGYP